MVEQLRREVQIQREPVSVTAEDFVKYIRENEAADQLLQKPKPELLCGCFPLPGN